MSPRTGTDPALSTELCGMELAHPVLNGSGTFDAIAARATFGDDLLDAFPFAGFVSKTITPQPRAGNPPPRLWEAASGLINSIGLPNKGLDGFLTDDLPRLADLPVPLIVSVMATDAEDFVVMCGALDGRDEVAAIELNVSCPNVKSGLIVGESPSECESLISRLRPATGKPLIVKLTPNVDPVPVAEAAEAAGADALSLVNTLRASAAAPSGGPWLGAETGGLSGPAVQPVALAQVTAVASRTEIPVIGMGGVSSGEDAIDFLQAGATAVAVGTENFRDPAAGSRIATEIGEELRRRGIGSLTDLTDGSDRD